jgi:hypothetical protein
MEVTYTVRNELKSSKEKIMKEKPCTYFETTFGWKRELISDDMYKTIYRHTTPKGYSFYTYIGMRTSHSENLFVNIDIWNKYYYENILIVLSDYRKGVPPKYIWMDEAKKHTLEHGVGATPGIKVPDRILHDVSELKDL